MAMCKKLANVDKLRTASTPFSPEASLTVTNEEIAGELAGSACVIFTKALWAVRLSRLDIPKAISDPAGSIACWARNDDKRLYRLFCYISSTRCYKWNYMVIFPIVWTLYSGNVEANGFPAYRP